VDRARKVAAWTAAGLTFVAGIACMAVEVPAPASPQLPLDPEASSGGLLLVAVHCLVAAAFAALGGLVVSRRPRNAIGWLLVLIGVSFAAIAVSNQVYLRVFLDDGSASAPSLALMWVGNWAYLPAFVSAVVFVPLLFPTGRPPSRGWAALAWLAGLCGTLVFLGTAFSPGPLSGGPAAGNPVGTDLGVVAGVDTVGFVGLVPAALGAIASLVLRFRRSTGVERQQLLWLAAAASLLPFGFASALLIGDYAWPVMLLCLLVVAGAVAIAMLRYRLYDIDVVVNRTLVYFALTVTLASSYVGGVLLLQLLLRPLTESSDVAVAGSTLVVAALFGPARRAIQRLVDRRFYRRRYDARRTVADFTGRLRQQVDLEALGADLSAVVRDTVQPEHVSIWLRPSSTAPAAVTIPERSAGRPEAEGRPSWPR
jgi:hypothetical protein